LGSLSDSLRIEGTLTAPIAFRHSEFANGWTINNKIIGDSLGPDGARVLLSWSHDWEHLGKPWETTLSGWWEMTDNNSYAYPAAYNGTTTITDLGPNENRWVFDLQHQFRWENWSLKADLAYLHTVNADRVGGKTDSNVRVGALVEIPLY
jgi:hypothetical protein